MRRRLALVLAIGLGAGACGGAIPDGAPGGAGNVGRVPGYVAYWEFSSGNLRGSCNSGLATNEDLTGFPMQIDAGPGARVVTRQGNGCNIEYLVGSDGAELAPEQKCVLEGVSDGDPYVATLSYFRGAMRSAGGESLHFFQEYELLVRWQSLRNIRCALSMVGQLERIDDY